MVTSELGEYNFRKDINKGKSAERFLSDLIIERDDSVVEILPNENSKYDLMVVFNDSTCCTIEVKNDILSQKTSNVAVEVFSRGKKSGISSSEADYFVYFVRESDNTKVFIIRRISLLELIKTSRFREVLGGDKDKFGIPTTKMVLIPKDIFYKYARNITNLKKYNFGIRRYYYGYDRWTY